MSDASNIAGTPAPRALEFQLQWVGDSIGAPAPVNQAMIMADMPTPPSTQPDSHIVTFGYVTPPAMFPGMSAAELDSLSAQPLPVLTAGRYLFTANKLRELRDQITQHLEQHNPS